MWGVFRPHKQSHPLYGTFLYDAMKMRVTTQKNHRQSLQFEGEERVVWENGVWFFGYIDPLDLDGGHSSHNSVGRP